MPNFLLTLFAALLGLIAPGPPRGAANPPAVKVDGAAQARLLKRYGDLPLSFEANQGQADRRAKFLARGQGYLMLFRPDGFVLELAPSSLGKPGAAPAVLRMRLARANPAPAVLGVDEMAGKSHYFIGNDPTRWHTNVPTYARLRYPDVYPGVDLVCYGNQRQLEYDFVLAPHADPARLRLSIDGAAKVAIDAEGNLLLRTAGGDVSFRRPTAYQPAESGATGQHFTPVRYRLKGSGEIGFEVAAYDPRRPLVIDPVLSYATYLGGNGGDVGKGIAVDASGNAYVTGSTASVNFPTASPLEKANNGGSDVFVTKLDPTGSTLIYSTYLGGSGDDSGTAVAVDSSGNAYVTGSTTSTNFPTTTGVFQVPYGGNGDAFVVKLNPSGSSLVYSSYLGGGGADFGQGIALDSSGNAYVTGSTDSTNFPTVKPIQGGNDGASDAFVAKINSTGTALVYSTYLGGSGADGGQGIAIDALGNAYVAGSTASTNFPTSNAFQLSSGGVHGFVTKLNADGSALVYSTYLGGSGADHALGIALDSSGSVYVAGDTSSLDFPTTPGVFQVANHGNTDAFVSKLTPAGSGLVYSTLLGGVDLDRATAIAVDASGNAYVTGLTQSRDFPTVRASQTSFGGGTCGTSACPDAFVSELNAQGASLIYSTYLGGSGADTGQAIHLDSSGNAYVAGGTASSNFTAVSGAFQGTYQGIGASGNAFVAKINPSDEPGLSVIPQPIKFGNQAINTTSTAQTVTVTNVGSAPLAIAGITASGPFAQTTQTNTCVSLAAGGGTCTISVTFTPTAVGAQAGQLTITDNAAGSPQQIALAGTGVAQAPAVTLSSQGLQFPDETVGATSHSQTVTLSNSGSAALAITGISITGDFTQVNNCGSSLNPGASCGISVTFKPTTTGSRTGAVSIADNATGSPQTVSLTGNGTAVYSLTSTATSSTILIGTASTTFTVSMSAPSSFTSAVNLSCESGATCSFSPASITPGQTSTLTVSGLSATSSNPTNLTVDGNTGTSGGTGSQTAKLSLSVFFQDFAIYASPGLNAVAAGQPATYTLSVTSINGFNQSVTLACGGPSTLPTGVTCSFNPSSVTPTASQAGTSTLTVKTTARGAAAPRSRREPGVPGSAQPALPWLILLCVSVILAAWAARRPARRLPGGRLRGAELWRLARLRSSLAVFVATTLLAALSTSCGNASSRSGELSGTQPGNYIVTITGTLGSNTAVSRALTVNLSVS